MIPGGKSIQTIWFNGIIALEITSFPAFGINRHQTIFTRRTEKASVHILKRLVKCDCGIEGEFFAEKIENCTNGINHASL
jgi:hypothetical protein